MMNKKQFLNNLLKDKNIKSFFKTKDCEELCYLHFSLGLYIRNEYLWTNKENCKLLSKFYNVSDIDEISNLIIKDLYYLKGRKLNI